VAESDHSAVFVVGDKLNVHNRSYSCATPWSYTVRSVWT